MLRTHLLCVVQFLEKQTELHQPLIHALGTFLHLAKTALLLMGMVPKGLACYRPGKS